MRSRSSRTAPVTSASASTGSRRLKGSQVYELWIAKDRKHRVSIGIFRPDANGSIDATVAIPNLGPHWRGLWLTHEQGTGKPGWSRDWVVAGTSRLAYASAARRRSHRSARVCCAAGQSAKRRKPCSVPSTRTSSVGTPGLEQPRGVRLALVAQHVVRGGDHERRRKIGEVLDERGGRLSASARRRRGRRARTSACSRGSGGSRSRTPIADALSSAGSTHG